MALGADFLAAIGETEQPTQTGIGDDFLKAIGEQPKAEEKPGFIRRLGSGIKEMVTGEKRTTKTTEEARPLVDMPEIRQDLFSTFASMFSGDEELANIMKSRYPGLETKTDEKGNVIFVSADGTEYANKPGFSQSDIPRIVANVMSFLPASKSPSLRGRMLGAAGTQAAIESGQAQLGGEADISEVALAAATEPVGDAASFAGKQVAKGIGKGIQAVRGMMPKQVAEEATEEVIREGAVEFGRKAKTAAKSKFLRQNEIRNLAGELPIDEQVFEDAERLGITEYLQPDHLTTNDSYKSFSQAIKSLPGSRSRQLEVEGLQRVADKTTDIIEQFGGTEDYSTLGFDIKNQMTSTVKELEDQAENLYSELRKNINPKTEVSADNVLAFINRQADELGGFEFLPEESKGIYRKLRPRIKDVSISASEIPEIDNIPFIRKDLEQSILGKRGKFDGQKQVEIKPTYALLDSIRKDLTAAKYKRQGQFKDATIGLIKKLESELMNDQKAAVDALGQTELFDTARQTVAIRKGLEDDLTSLFGKELDKSIVTPLTSAITNLPKGNVDNFINFIKRIPEDQRKSVVASGLSVAFGKQARNGKVSFINFADYWDKLRKNKKAYAALMSNLPDESKALLNSYANVSRAINKTSRFIGTGRLNAIEKAMDGSSGFMTKLLSNATILGTLPYAPQFSTILALGKSIVPGNNKGVLQLADELISSDDFIRAVRTLPDNEDKAVNIIIKSPSFKKYANFVKRFDSELRENPEKWVRAGLQATRQQREDQLNGN